jgi:hypothetical protein
MMLRKRQKRIAAAVRYLLQNFNIQFFDAAAAPGVKSSMETEL